MPLAGYPGRDGESGGEFEGGVRGKELKSLSILYDVQKLLQDRLA
jgi:hypothetical protein